MTRALIITAALIVAAQTAWAQTQISTPGSNGGNAVGSALTSPGPASATTQCRERRVRSAGADDRQRFGVGRRAANLDPGIERRQRCRLSRASAGLVELGPAWPQSVE